MHQIELRNVNRVFNKNTDNTFQALKGINMIVEPGDFISIMGPSGSGKSTLMNIIGMLDVADSGSYWLKEVDITKTEKSELPMMRRQEIGFVFQTFNLLNRLSVYENVRMPLIYSKKKYGKRSKVDELIKMVNLGHRRNYLPVNLSGGEKQRVAIARALVNDPRIIVADEPTGNLDTKSGSEIMKSLVDLNKEGRTIILVTHDPQIDKYAKRHFKMVDGILTED
ncbi:ABC transporter ATP-binding protein [Patescibacteria group bacterium]|nr:ABC transporter ATP-binding protein [Patescibacteria group bacterium]MBU1890161.1 ABC transporter ATP-binding protein [Patescibacteria group bacterium]